MNIAGDELANFVHDEEQRLARAAPLHQLHAALGEVARRDVGALHRRLAPAIRRRVRRRIQLVHDAACLLHGDGDQALADVPVLVERLLVLGLEGVEATRFLQGDLQLGQVEIAGIPEALQKESVHDLGDALVAGADAAVGGDIEDDGLRGDLLGDVAEQHFGLGVADPLGEQLCRANTSDRAVLESESEVFREARLT